MKEYLDKICPYCKSKFTETDDIVVCSACDMPHHKECWIENQGCTTFGCMGTIKGVDGMANSVTQGTMNFNETISVHGESNVTYCTKCGAQNKRTQAFCTKCGMKLATAPVTSTNYGQNPVNNNYRGQYAPAQYQPQNYAQPQNSPQHINYPNQGYNNAYANPAYRAPQQPVQNYPNQMYNQGYNAPQYANRGYNTPQQQYPAQGYVQPQYYNNQRHVNPAYHQGNYNRPQQNYGYNQQYVPAQPAPQYNQQYYQQPAPPQYPAAQQVNTPQYAQQVPASQAAPVQNPLQPWQTAPQSPDMHKTED